MNVASDFPTSIPATKSGKMVALIMDRRDDLNVYWTSGCLRYAGSTRIETWLKIAKTVAEARAES